MRKLNLILLAILFVFNFIYAQQRDVNEALQIAGSFFESTQQSARIKKASGNKNTVQLLYSKVKEQNSKENLYYIFGQNKTEGFVIVSGDERTHQILAYSDEESFDPQNIPENMQDWLRYYEAEIMLLKSSKAKNGLTVSTQTNATTNNTFTSAVSPLLKSIKWNQGDPYNLLCPVITSNNKKTVVGCVATAMAQVMMYHRWPEKGTGSNTYTSETHKFNLSADFSKVTFNWDNMTDTYGSGSTAIQKNEVAKLMYNCGIAVNMDYDLSSGAQPKTMAKAMKNYFGYDQNLQYYTRNYYTREEWIHLLKTEIDEKRPVLYGGFSADGGHQFVCDGYDNNGLFHFNWGWGGTSNGYFQISALDPAEQGIGGSTSGYNSGQGIVVGLKKPKSGAKNVAQIQMNDTLKCSVDSLFRINKFSLNVKKIFNYGVSYFNGNFAVGVFGSDGTWISNLSSHSVSNLQDGYGWNTYDFTGLSLPASLAEGNYQIHILYKSTTDREWMKVRSLVGTPSYLNVRITKYSAYFSTPQETKPQLALNTLTVGGKLYKGKNARFNVKITNNGEEYNSQVGIYLQSVEDETIYSFIKTENVNIAKGETRELNFGGEIDLEIGQYYLAVMYDDKNNPNNVQQLSSLDPIQTVSVLNAPTGTPSLRLKSAISFSDVTKVKSDYDVLTAEIINLNGFYEKKMVAFIFNLSGGSSLTYIGHQDVYLDKGETQNIDFKGSIDLNPGKYRIVLYGQDADNKWIKVVPENYSVLDFTLVTNYTGLHSTIENTELSIYPVPARDQLGIKSEYGIRSISIYNLTGQLLLQRNVSGIKEEKVDVSSFEAGSYILKVQTENGYTTNRFIKQ